MIKKKCKKHKSGFIVKLPLFYILDKKYNGSIPTLKLITNKVICDTNGFIKKNIDELYKNYVARYKTENPGKRIIIKKLINPLTGKAKFPTKYINKLKKDFLKYF